MAIQLSSPFFWAISLAFLAFLLMPISGKISFLLLKITFLD
jgi:hypothetical protein